MLQITIPIRISDLLRSMPQLRVEITNAIGDDQFQKQECTSPHMIIEPPLQGKQVIDPMLLIERMEKKLAVVHTQILGRTVKNTIVE